VRLAIAAGLVVALASPTFSQSPKAVLSSDAASLVAAGERSFTAGDLDRAEAQFRQAIDRAPTLASAHYGLGLVLEARKDLDGAARELSAAISSAPDMAKAYDRYGFVLGQQGRLDDAVAEFRRAVALEPTLFDAQYHLGVTEFLRRNFEGGHHVMPVLRDDFQDFGKVDTTLSCRAPHQPIRTSAGSAGRWAAS